MKPETSTVKTRDIVIIALLVLNLLATLVRDEPAQAASATRKTPPQKTFQSASERALPLLRGIRDVLGQIDKKMSTLIELQKKSVQEER